jgi:hypothetical protein
MSTTRSLQSPHAAAGIDAIPRRDCRCGRRQNKTAGSYHPLCGPRLASERVYGATVAAIQPSSGLRRSMHRVAFTADFGPSVTVILHDLAFVF